jgi:Arm DNA-binding domain
MPLTEIAIRQAKPKDKGYKLADADGMFLFIHPNGSKYWRLKYRFVGKEKLLALGVYPDVSLADARERRSVAHKMLAGGKDPGEEKKENKRFAVINAQNSFEAVAPLAIPTKFLEKMPLTGRFYIRHLPTTKQQ